MQENVSKDSITFHKTLFGHLKTAKKYKRILTANYAYDIIRMSTVSLVSVPLSR